MLMHLVESVGSVRKQLGSSIRTVYCKRPNLVEAEMEQKLHRSEEAAARMDKPKLSAGRSILRRHHSGFKDKKKEMTAVDIVIAIVDVEELDFTSACL